MIVFFGPIVGLILLAIGTEVWIRSPDLRTDGLHGVLAPQALGFKASPVILSDLDDKQEPPGALYLGG